MRLIGRLSKPLWCLNLALVAVVLFVGIGLLPSGRHERGAGVKTPLAGTANAPGATEQKTRDTIDPSLILERNIFGVEAEAVVGRPGETKAGAVGGRNPEVKRELPLRLLGTVIDEKGTSYAILENVATKAQDIYRIDDMIGDTRIEGIEQNRIVVVNAGMRETLSIALTDREVPATMVAAEGSPPEPVKAGLGEVVRVVSDSQRQINTSASSSSAGRAARFLSKLQLSPHAVNGQPDGLRLSGLGDSTTAQLVGLQDGDIIKAVNGHAVPNQRKAAQVLRKARNLGSAEIELVRGQVRRSLTFRAGSW